MTATDGHFNNTTVVTTSTTTVYTYVPIPLPTLLCKTFPIVGRYFVNEINAPSGKPYIHLCNIILCIRAHDERFQRDFARRHNIVSYMDISITNRRRRVLSLSVHLMMHYVIHLYSRGTSDHFDTYSFVH